MHSSDLPHLSQALVMLDFDGTLVELAETPDAVSVPPDLPELLQDLHNLSHGLTLITGRAIADLMTLIPDYDGDVFGSHGFEIRREGRCTKAASVDEDVLSDVWREAQSIVETAPDVLIFERKPAGAVVHFRKDPSKESRVRNAARRIVDRHEGFELHDSKMAVELRLQGVSKADAARSVVASAKAEAVPIFAGDDVTDEDAMDVIASAGGVTIKIGEGSSRAAHRLAAPADLLALLADWKKGG